MYLDSWKEVMNMLENPGMICYVIWIFLLMLLFATDPLIFVCSRSDRWDSDWTLSLWLKVLLIQRVKVSRPTMWKMWVYKFVFAYFMRGIDLSARLLAILFKNVSNISIRLSFDTVTVSMHACWSTVTHAWDISWPAILAFAVNPVRCLYRYDG